MLSRIRKTEGEREGGFTLIELLVVIIIIGILAAIAIPTFLNQRQKGYKADMKSTAKNAATAIESYNADNAAGYAALDDSDGSGLLAAEGFKKASTQTVLVKANATAYCISVSDTRVGSGVFFKYTSATGVPTESATACATPAG